MALAPKFPHTEDLPSSLPLLPPELWCRISEYIEDEELERLIGLNRLFNQLVGDRRYREMAFVARPPQFWKDMEAFRSPGLAAHVKALRIMPQATWDAIHAIPVASALVPNLAIMADTNKPRQMKLRSWLILAISILHGRSKLQKPTHSAPPPITLSKSLSSLSSKRKVQAITSIAGTFCNVKRLTIRWESGQNKTDCPLLYTFLHTFNNNLVALHLIIPLTILEKFQSYSSFFTGLEDIDITLSWDRWQDTSSRSTIDHLALFINNLPGPLQSLSINTTGGVYVYACFGVLKARSSLKHLSVVIPYRPIYSAGLVPINLPDTEGLNRLLRAHPLLQSLNLNFRECYFNNPTSNSVSDWCRHCFQDVTFEALENLKLGLGYPFNVATNYLDGLIPLMRGIKHFTVYNIGLTPSGVLKVLRKCSSNTALETLSLYVKEINCELFSLLAEHLPSLKRLILECDKVIDAGPIGIEMQTCRKHDALLYDSWSLWNIEIWTRAYEVGPTLQYDLMRAIAGNVPSITSFAGQPFTRYTDSCG